MVGLWVRIRQYINFMDSYVLNKRRYMNIHEGNKSILIWSVFIFSINIFISMPGIETEVCNQFEVYIVEFTCSVLYVINTM